MSDHRKGHVTAPHELYVKSNPGLLGVDVDMTDPRAWYHTAASRKMMRSITNQYNRNNNNRDTRDGQAPPTVTLLMTLPTLAPANGTLASTSAVEWRSTVPVVATHETYHSAPHVSKRAKPGVSIQNYKLPHIERNGYDSQHVSMGDLRDSQPAMMRAVDISDMIDDTSVLPANVHSLPAVEKSSGRYNAKIRPDMELPLPKLNKKNITFPPRKWSVMPRRYEIEHSSKHIKHTDNITRMPPGPKHIDATRAKKYVELRLPENPIQKKDADHFRQTYLLKQKAALKLNTQTEALDLAKKRKTQNKDQHPEASNPSNVQRLADEEYVKPFVQTRDGGVVNPPSGRKDGVSFSPENGCQVEMKGPPPTAFKDDTQLFLLAEISHLLKRDSLPSKPNIPDTDIEEIAPHPSGNVAADQSKRYVYMAPNDGFTERTKTYERGAKSYIFTLPMGLDESDGYADADDMTCLHPKETIPESPPIGDDHLPKDPHNSVADQEPTNVPPMGSLHKFKRIEVFGEKRPMSRGKASDYVKPEESPRSRIPTSRPAVYKLDLKEYPLSPKSQTLLPESETMEKKPSILDINVTSKLDDGTDVLNSKAESAVLLNRFLADGHEAKYGVPPAKTVHKASIPQQYSQRKNPKRRGTPCPSEEENAGPDTRIATEMLE